MWRKTGMRCKNYYYYYKEALSPKFCEDVIKYGLSQQNKRALTGDSKHFFNEEDKKQLKLLKKKRDSHVVWMDDVWILREIRPWVARVNKEAGWNFQWDAAEAFQFTQYEKGQYYGWHVDSSESSTQNKIRKISLTLTLSKPEDYEGGELEFCLPLSGSSKNQKKICTEILKQGSIVFFPSFVLHQVKPILKGIRHSLVCWHSGEPFR